ncbi:hypothetical protein EVG20_g7516 [Dentipellis fragilis]|uniref:DUF7330 domain-containing protein n=1 Tax=Dentipellis fragilis TaxID=205917 RepID=A0A4Y9YCV2_9AGAM|nr:hypothetical protein EVG20_g7516 [Dentipellis fragilis]
MGHPPKLKLLLLLRDFLPGSAADSCPLHIRTDEHEMCTETSLSPNLSDTMILKNDKNTNEQESAGATNRADNILEGELHPPPYSPLEPSTSAAAVHVPSAAPAPPLPPTNFLYIYRPLAAIKGEYLLDISAARPPTNVLDNLRLESTHAVVDGQIWVADEPERENGSGREDAACHARIKLINQIAKVRCIVHANGPRRPLLSIVAKSSHGVVTLKLPRSFHGQLILYTMWRVRLSPELERRAATVSEVDGTRVYFIGSRPQKWRTTIQLDGTDNDPESTTEDGELVDEAYAGSAFGVVKVGYDDEVEPERGSGIFSSFMKKLGL